LFRPREILALLTYMGDQERTHSLKTLLYRIKDETGKIAAQRGGQGTSVSSMSSRKYQAKIDHCEEIRLALLPPGIATCPQYCKITLTVPTELLVVTTQHIAYRCLIRSIVQHKLLHFGLELFVRQMIPINLVALIIQRRVVRAQSCGKMNTLSLCLRFSVFVDRVIVVLIRDWAF
jgi:hypothetical protein